MSTCFHLFVAYMVGRYHQTQADSVDQLFNSAEKRLARTLLLLARSGKEERSENVVPKISQENIGGNDRYDPIELTSLCLCISADTWGLVDHNGGLEVRCSTWCGMSNCLFWKNPGGRVCTFEQCRDS